MAKRVLYFAVVLAAFVVSATIVSAQDSAKSNHNSNMATNSAQVARSSRPRVGLGFNGIPFDGSHREATRMRRAYRSGQR